MHERDHVTSDTLGMMGVIDLRALHQFLSVIGSPAEDLIFGAGKCVYHYTDLAGLIGIVKSNDLWLTNARYSNDEEEMLYGLRTTKSEILRLRNQNLGNPDWKAYLDIVESRLGSPSDNGVFICCFCLEDNLLSQWRGYGANGTGVSIALDPSRFSEVTGVDSPQNGLMRLWKVFYEDSTQRSIVENAMQHGFAQASTLSIEDRAEQALAAIRFFVPTFKSNGFGEEHECRLIFTPPSTCPVKRQYRVTRGMLVPYFSLRELASHVPGWKLPIRGVCVGPSPNKVLNRESVEALLRSAGYGDVKVTASDTPYRG